MFLGLTPGDGPLATETPGDGPLATARDFTPPPMEKGGRVEDMILGYGYNVFPRGTDPFEGSIAKVRMNLGLEPPTWSGLHYLSNRINRLLVVVIAVASLLTLFQLRKGHNKIAANRRSANK